MGLFEARSATLEKNMEDAHQALDITLERIKSDRIATENKYGVHNLFSNTRRAFAPIFTDPIFIPEDVLITYDSQEYTFYDLPTNRLYRFLYNNPNYKYPPQYNPHSRDLIIDGSGNIVSQKDPTDTPYITSENLALQGRLRESVYTLENICDALEPYVSETKLEAGKLKFFNNTQSAINQTIQEISRFYDDDAIIVRFRIARLLQSVLALGPGRLPTFIELGGGMRDEEYIHYYYIPADSRIISTNQFIKDEADINKAGEAESLAWIFFGKFIGERLRTPYPAVSSNLLTNMWKVLRSNRHCDSSKNHLEWNSKIVK